MNDRQPNTIEPNTIEYSEYEDEYGIVAMFYDPDNQRAWIRASTTVPVKR
ncbi:hypothetical protein SAMN05421858_1466 [Haladaptatus litoreus]|uniref:Uncharacterized protein n=1 Tax=Haladaptatus litoreus TaxID=553468 RepID=A0A1N6Y949_9EURY|nr:hypothetical protein [Haladaptatus litoreus]SIR11162.1 hypothetical protein SAMN05421858_1466 [Haladaptatus litoreus]